MVSAPMPETVSWLGIQRVKVVDLENVEQFSCVCMYVSEKYQCQTQGWKFEVNLALSLVWCH